MRGAGCGGGDPEGPSACRSTWATCRAAGWRRRGRIATGGTMVSCKRRRRPSGTLHPPGPGHARARASVWRPAPTSAAEIGEIRNRARGDHPGGSRWSRHDTPDVGGGLAASCSRCSVGQPVAGHGGASLPRRGPQGLIAAPAAPYGGGDAKRVPPLTAAVRLSQHASGALPPRSSSRRVNRPPRRRCARCPSRAEPAGDRGGRQRRPDRHRPAPARRPRSLVPWSCVALAPAGRPRLGAASRAACAIGAA